MKKAQFVDAVRGCDPRDKDPVLKRVIELNDSEFAYAFVYVMSEVLLLIAQCVLFLTLQYNTWIYMITLSAISLAGMITARMLLGSPRYKRVPIPIDILRTYRGQHVYIHWMNDTTGYEDGMVPYYGDSEEFIRFVVNHPEICPAPFDQYGHGWVAYTRYIPPEELNGQTELK